MKGNYFTTDDLPLDEIYDYDSDEKEKADAEIEALERNEKENGRDMRKQGHIEEADREVMDEIARMRHMVESLSKIHEILELPHETNKLP